MNGTSNRNIHKWILEEAGNNTEPKKKTKIISPTDLILDLHIDMTLWNRTPIYQMETYVIFSI